MELPSFSHLDPSGKARMVDVGGKPITLRVAEAEGVLVFPTAVAERLRAGSMPKGDVFQVARIAAIQGAKRTDELIPLCHSLPLDTVGVEFEWLEQRRLQIRVSVAATARTGVEMEALVAVSMAALTIYDMCKAIDKGIEIERIRLLAKSGGASGDYVHGQVAPES